MVKLAPLESIRVYRLTPSELRLARQSRRILVEHTDAKGQITLQVRQGKKEQSVTIPAPVARLITHLLAGQNEAELSEKELTTQEAATMLNVSRPFLIKLLESGKIPYHKAGSHRRIRATDLHTYQQKTGQGQSRALSALTRQAQELNMGY